MSAQSKKFVEIKEITPPRTLYVNIYSDDRLLPHDTRHQADMAASSNFSRLACVKITFTEGQYDE